MTVYGRAPLTYNDDMLELSRKLKCSSRHLTAKNIFDWMQENITYNNYAKGIIRSLFLNYDYKSAHQVFRSCEGICLDQAYLYCVLARYAGVSSNVVDVKRDYTEKKVWHSCCYVNTGNERLLVDTAYSRFDIKHKDYIIMSDEDVRKEYYSIRHCYEDCGGIVEKLVVHDEPSFKDISSESGDILAIWDSINSGELFKVGGTNSMPYNHPATKIPDCMNFESPYYQYQIPDYFRRLYGLKEEDTIDLGNGVKIDIRFLKK